MASEDAVNESTAMDSIYQEARSDAAAAIVAACKHTIAGLVCTPCTRAADIARGIKPGQSAWEEMQVAMPMP